MTSGGVTRPVPTGLGVAQLCDTSDQGNFWSLVIPNPRENVELPHSKKSYLKEIWKIYRLILAIEARICASQEIPKIMLVQISYQVEGNLSICLKKSKFSLWKHWNPLAWTPPQRINRLRGSVCVCLNRSAFINARHRSERDIPKKVRSELESELFIRPINYIKQ